MKARRVVVVSVVVLIALVVGVLSRAMAAPKAEDASPAAVVEAFYEWYLDYIGDRGDRAVMRNPMVDRAYRSSEYLTQEFIAEVDQLLESFDGAGYDPFLQAQDIPESFEVGEAVVADGVAQVPVETSFEGHRLMVTLEERDGSWEIRNIAAAPDMVVRLFYGWYLRYIDRDGEMRNPLVDRAYRDSRYLSEAFVEEIDETLASFDRSGFDPLLLAQDIPVRIEVGGMEVLGREARVTVEMFWGGNPTPSQRVVELRLMNGQWMIEGVSF